jgi:hypothetical protein
VLGDDEEGDDDLYGDKEYGPVARRQKPGKDEKTEKTPMAASAAQGAATRKTPKPVATPLPPRKPSQMGNIWPRTAQRAARASILSN